MKATTATLPAWPQFAVEFVTDPEAIKRFVAATADASPGDRIVTLLRAATQYNARRVAILQPIPQRTAALLVDDDNRRILNSAVSDVLAGAIKALEQRNSGGDGATLG